MQTYLLSIQYPMLFLQVIKKIKGANFFLSGVIDKFEYLNIMQHCVQLILICVISKTFGLNFTQCIYNYFHFGQTKVLDDKSVAAVVLLPDLNIHQ